ncbi:MAG: DUF2024 family protein, partial [Bacteroidia bacterium]|nr:DUF2024 family protein [Bacteroidia bacterium]
MQVAVWDTYVTKKDGRVIHCDSIAPASIKDATINYEDGNSDLTANKHQP